MARLIRYVPKTRGLRKLRASRDVDADLERRAHAVASLAEAIYGAIGEPTTVEVLQDASDTREPRARVAVIARSPKALRVEAKERVLGGSLDAARG